MGESCCVGLLRKRERKYWETKAILENLLMSIISVIRYEYNVHDFQTTRQESDLWLKGMEKFISIFSYTLK
jgi:hypothetical protein